MHSPTKTSASVLRGLSTAMKLTTLAALFTVSLLLQSLTCSAQKTTVTKDPLDVTVDGPELPDVNNPGECPEINWPLHLVGTSKNVITDTVRKGVHYLAIHNVVTGTATDAEGNEFKFEYVNNFRTSFSETTGEVFVNFDTDHFSMHGPAGNLSVGFVGSVIFAGDGSFLGIQIDHAHGNVACDPI